MVLLDGLPDVIDSLASPGVAEIERRTTSRDSFGDPVEGPIQRFTVDPVIIQPLTGRDLLQLPEGLRSSAQVLVHTQRKLRTALESRDLQADVLIYQPPGESEPFRYRMLTVVNWCEIGGFYSSVGGKEELD